MYSVRFAEENGVSQEELLSFFTGPFKDCLIGKADTKEEMKPFLDRWGYAKDINQYFHDWHTYEDKPDEEILEDIQHLRKKGILCIVATNQEHYRTQYLKEKMNFSTLFDAVYSSSDIGILKHDRACMEALYKKAQEFKPLDKDEILFIDDDQKNIDSAIGFGFRGLFYRERKDFESLPQIKELMQGR